MKIVVAGGTGFLGRHISRQLIDGGHSVTVMSRDPTKVARISDLNGAGAVRGDVTETASLAGTLDGVDAVVGAVQFPNHPVEVPRRGLTYDRYDRQGTEHLLAEAVRAGVTRYFYMSGAGASSSSPVTWYRAKGRAEDAVRSSGMSWAILRPSWAYGPEDRALNRLHKIARFSPIVPRLGLRAQRIMPVFVDDIARAVRLIFERDDAWDRVYEIGGPDILTMGEVMRAMLDVAGLRRVIVPVPAAFAKLGVSPLVLMPKPFMTPQGVEFAIQDGLIDNAAIEALGLRPVSLRDGLATYLGKR